ncbi:MAG: DUF4296 domain-containing protein [Cyclobacteriaceae bacterium]|nr:DUF4296 domain-containing protein [Cyclobacteriaceae bacterium]
MSARARGGILMLLFVLGCSQRPDGRLSREDFTAMMINFYLVEARISAMHTSDDSARKIFEVYERTYLKEHEIPDSVLRRTYEYYMAHPKDLESVYDTVIDSMSLREQRTTVVHH